MHRLVKIKLIGAECSKLERVARGQKIWWSMALAACHGSAHGQDLPEQD